MARVTVQHSPEGAGGKASLSTSANDVGLSMYMHGNRGVTAGIDWLDGEATPGVHVWDGKWKLLASLPEFK
jgi:hypothetical protein